MAYSPPLDGLVGVFIIFYFFLGIAAFVMVTFAEALALWLFAWGSFLHSLLTSFIMNLASTVVGIILAFAFETDLTVGIFLLLFAITLVIEGGVMLGMNDSRYGLEEVGMLAVIFNIISYVFLTVGIIEYFDVL